MHSDIPPFVFSLILVISHILSVSAATGAAVALPRRVAGAHLHRAGQEQEEPIFLFLRQRDSLSASQTEGSRPLRLYAKAPLLAGPSDCHRN